MSPKSKSISKNQQTKSLQVDIDHEWLRGFYNQVGREVSLARESQRETHNWVITLIGGAVAAVWALGGDSIDYPTPGSFIIIMAITPLVFRFFVRSCLEYQIFNRWLALRNALDAYYFSKDFKSEESALALESLVEQIRLYYFQWKQPKTNSKMIWDNFQLAYGWPLILIVTLIILGIIVVPLEGIVLYALLISIFWMTFEIINFIKYFRGRYQAPKTSIDIRKL